MSRTKEVICTNTGRFCNICGGSFDSEEVCSIGKHERGEKYYAPGSKKDKKKLHEVSEV